MNCQICGKVAAGAGENYQGYPQAGGFCTCYQQCYQEIVAEMNTRTSLASIGVELRAQRKMLEEILALLKKSGSDT